MIRKEDLLASMIRDCDIAKHLFTKLGADSFDYRPTPEQRSTLELLQYLSVCGIGAAQCMTQKSWDGYGEFAKGSKEMTAEQFPAAMDRQIAGLRDLFGSLTEEDLETRETTMPWGESMPLGVGLLNAPAKWLTAYRMQLFLYAKASGATDIGTSNAWMGMDRPA